MKKYEIMYILEASLEEAARKETIAKLHQIIESGNGKVTDVKEWGARDLAYPIKKKQKGYYVVIKATADNAILAEFDRIAKLDQNVLRHLVTVDQE